MSSTQLTPAANLPITFFVRDSALVPQGLNWAFTCAKFAHVRNLEPGCPRAVASHFYLRSKEITEMPEYNNSEDLLKTESEQIDAVTTEDANVKDANTDKVSGEDTNDEKPKRSISEARLRANRENAKKSTGPRTAEG